MPITDHMSWPVIISACVGTSSAILANMIYFVMIGKVNVLLPEKDRISYIWWGTDVRRHFRRLYPRHKLVFFLDSCVALMILSGIAIVRFWVFGSEASH